MTSSSTTTHGLAATIRSSTESETYDLGGVANIETVIQQAFEEPFESLANNHTMIRITLIVGAGKQARQKYNPQMIRQVTTTLQSIGYTEDRGASCIWECAGLYKLQHDTGKNLKTVVVFPKVGGGGNGNGGGNGGNESGSGNSTNNNNTIEPFYPHSSIEYKVAACSVQVFTNMVQSKFPTWAEQKALQQLIEDSIMNYIQECDDLLLHGKPFPSPSLEYFYTTTCTEMDMKLTQLKQSMHTLVEKEQLTQHDCTLLLKQMQHRITELNQQSKPVPKSILERQDKIRTLLNTGSTIEYPKLHHHAQLGKLWKQIQPLWNIRDTNASGKLLSVHDTKLLGQKEDLLEQIHQLESSSRGWLEDDEIFHHRVQSCRQLYHSKYNIKSTKQQQTQQSQQQRASYSAIAKMSSKSSSGGSSNNNNNKSSKGNSNYNNSYNYSNSYTDSMEASSPTITSDTKVKPSSATTKWITPAQRIAEKQAKKKKKLQKGDIFGAMALTNNNDSSSDDDDDDDDVDNHEDNNDHEQNDDDDNDQHQAEANTTTTTTTTTTGNKKKNKKKKNNNNKNNNTVISKAENAALNQAFAKNQALAKQQEKAKQEEIKASPFPIVLLRDIIFPIIMALITWILQMILGSPNKKKKKN